MRNKLLIKKEKNTYLYENGGKEVFNESKIAMQCLENDCEQIYKVDSIEDVKKYTRKPEELKSFFERKEFDEKYFAYIEEIVNSITDTEYIVSIAIEEILIQKCIIENLCIGQTTYNTVSYNISRNNMLVASEAMVFDALNKSEIENIIECIQNEISWDKKEKTKCLFLGYDWVFSAEAAGFIFHECIGHILEEELFAISGYSIGDRLFNGNINIYENWRNTKKIDDYGNSVMMNVNLISNGIIQNTLSGRGKRENNSGNGYTEDPDFPPLARMNSMYVEMGEEKDDIVSQTKKGVYIERISSGEYNPITGEIGLCVSQMNKITNGKFTEAYEPVSILFNINQLKEVEIEMEKKKKSTQSLCGKYGSLKKVEYTTARFKMRWKENGKFITNRDF